MEKENAKSTLYIPVGIKSKPEYFDGFGKDERKQAGLISLVGGVVDIVFFLVTGNISVSIVSMMVIAAGSVMMTIKDRTNLSAVDQMKNMLHYAKSQKEYPYVALDEWRFK
ncbi:hypothetical protein [Desulfitobacterium chlororespirans]|uniref:Uncharacterized protein n=1 Tax=Desulfitobacterium chlororespirans DSM 11544 TaxID=1121395 RepID=A0A1M7UYD5_9FIRM|nr:hypothetical protein [Desulfitobacterium chlororespirans]SHN87930.1 hypothetical protein SAMN02745215_05035 [Desulfitobacterium chlororespirans DSM 11544]